MEKWKIKTDCLKGFEVGDVVKKIQPTNRLPKLECVKVESIDGLEKSYFDADLIELKPDWFEKIEESQDIYVLGGGGK